MFFDLASLAKPLVTAPLALATLDLDRDRRGQLGFRDHSGPITVRGLLCHAAGLPNWLPFTGEPLARQLERGFPLGAHPKLRTGRVGASLYSDLGYRLLADLLEEDAGLPFGDLARASGLTPFPWAEPPVFVPQGEDEGMWRACAPGLPFPPRDPSLPNDANARAGMRGHAGFGADAAAFQKALEAWVASGLPLRMARDAARTEGGTPWGLGLQRALRGRGRFASVLEGLPPGLGGVHGVVWGETRLSPSVEDPGDPPEASDFWFHLGYTGPAIFFRPSDGLCLGILAHRAGPGGELLDADALQARRMEALAGFVSRFDGHPVQEMGPGAEG